MKELIKIESWEGKKTVNARGLWEFLKVQARFNDWIFRYIRDFNFQENQDFVVFTQNRVKGRPSVEYYLSLSMAKELSMLQRTARGKEARLYFIACEERLKTTAVFPTHLETARQLVTALEDNEKLLVEKEENEPKIKYFNNVSDAANAHTFNDAAKLLGWGRNRLFQKLRDDKILMGDNAPYQQHLEAKRFKVKERVFEVEGIKRITKTTYVTGKGMQWLQGKYTTQLKMF